MLIFVLILLAVATAGSIVWSARVFGISARDARDLAGKLTVPHPETLVDWPELRVDAVVSDPDDPKRVLVVGRWPAHPDPRALLVLELGAAEMRERQLLVRWRDCGASISPTWASDGSVLLCRRRTMESLAARVVAEATI